MTQKDLNIILCKLGYGYLNLGDMVPFPYILTIVNKSIEELEYEKACISKRLSHLLESNTIKSFDEVDPRTQEYKRDIREADKGRAAPETAPYCRYRTPCGICEVYTMTGLSESKCKYCK